MPMADVSNFPLPEKYNFTNEWSDLVQFEKNTNLIKFLKYVQESSGRKFKERKV